MAMEIATRTAWPWRLQKTETILWYHIYTVQGSIHHSMAGYTGSVGSYMKVPIWSDPVWPFTITQWITIIHQVHLNVCDKGWCIWNFRYCLPFISILNCVVAMHMQNNAICFGCDLLLCDLWTQHFAIVKRKLAMDMILEVVDRKHKSTHTQDTQVDMHVFVCENILQKFGDDNVVIFAPTPSAVVVHRMRALAAIKRPGSIITGRGCRCTFEKHWQQVCVCVCAGGGCHNHIIISQVLESHHIDVHYTNDEIASANKPEPTPLLSICRSVHLHSHVYYVFFLCFDRSRLRPCVWTPGSATTRNAKQWTASSTAAAEHFTMGVHLPSPRVHWRKYPFVYWNTKQQTVHVHWTVCFACTNRLC